MSPPRDAIEARTTAIRESTAAPDSSRTVSRRVNEPLHHKLNVNDGATRFLAVQESFRSINPHCGSRQSAASAPRQHNPTPAFTAQACDNR